MKLMNKVQGAANIMFVMFLPILLMSAGFTIYVSQQLLAHIKTMEAVEVAGLAVVAGPKENEAENIQYVRDIIERYVTDSFNVDINLTMEECDYESGCAQKQDIVAPLIRFDLQASTWHKTWLDFSSFSSGDINFGSEFAVSSEVTTMRYLSRPVDIYFIADFSGSMTNYWGRGVTRLQMLKNTIEKVLLYLEEQDSEYPARVSLSVYSDYNYQKIDNKYYKISHNYHDGRSWYPKETVGMMWYHPQNWRNIPVLPSGYRRIYFRQISEAQYHNIAPTTNYAQFFQKLSTFRASGGTYSWQGIISAAQQADKATNDYTTVNPEQIFIVLTDGQDGAVSFTRALMRTYGLCDKIRTRIGNKPNRFSKTADSKTVVTMAVIGMAHNVHHAPGFKACFGDRIYVAKSGSDDVYKYIFNLLNEVSGRFEHK